MAAVTRMKGGIDLGGTKIQAVVTDGEAAVLGSARRDTPRKGGPPAVAFELAETLRAALDDAGVEPMGLAGIGIGAPGSIDAETGTVLQVANIDGWDSPFELGPALAEELGRPVRIGNDVSVAVDAEHRFGAGRGLDSFLGVFWGTGVGGGLMFDGKPWLGRGAAGEIGHMVIKRGGARCPCGRRGCVEAYAGRGAMEARANHLHEKGQKTDLFEIMRDHGHDRLTSGIWERALKHKDPMAEKLIKRALKALGAGIASACNLIDPEAVIIGGGLGVRFGESYMEKIHAQTIPHLFVGEANAPAMRVAELGDLGGAIGASLLFAR